MRQRNLAPEARRIAQAIVRHGFNVEAAVAELRPDIRNRNVFGARIMRDENVRLEIEKIMNKAERNAQKFIDGLWIAAEALQKYIDDPTLGPPPKHILETGQTAMRLLARGYIGAKGGKLDEKAPQQLVVEGLDVNSLTGEIPKKVN